MKWPNSVTLIRHDTSAYNILKEKKAQDPIYQKFLTFWKRNPDSPESRELAQKVQEKFALGIGDAETPLADAEGRQAFETGKYLYEHTMFPVPDVIFVSPYKRALLTLHHVTRGCPTLVGVKIYEEERIREQEHGLACLYNDWRVFHVLHPEQRKLRELEGPYWYRYPQGENVPDVRARNRSWLTTLTRDFPGKNVLVVTHHLNILATRANLERWNAERFIQADEKEKPINCGVTVYQGYPNEGVDGHLRLEKYNQKYYT